MEGYPGVVVHGPYTMQQLLNFAVDMNPAKTLRSFEMKALQPLYGALNYRTAHSFS